MDPHERAVSVWYRTAGLATRNRKDLAIDIIESEIRSAMSWFEAAKLVLTDAEPIAIARQLREYAERAIRPKDRTPPPRLWRIWPEHGGESHHVQGEADPNDITDTNPDHIFEIHPLTQVGPFSVRSGFHPIPNFKTKNAQDAFQNYEGARSKITPRPTPRRSGCRRLRTTTSSSDWSFWRLRPMNSTMASRRLRGCVLSTEKPLCRSGEWSS